MIKANPDAAKNPLIIPPPDWVARLHIFGAAVRGRRAVLQPAVREGDRRRLTGVRRRGHTRNEGRGWASGSSVTRGSSRTRCSLPGILWLLVFYVLPAFQMFISSFWSGSLETGFTFSFDNYTNYTNALDQFAPFYGRSIVYAAAATLLTFLIAYPLAYTIAFKGGRQKNLLLFLVVAPFFTSFLLRTISWKIILADSGLILGPLKDLGVVPEDFRLLATPIAVISGITYNFLPFMTLPIYVALEKVDFRLVEAAKDLYAGPWRPGGGIVGGDRGRRAGRGPGRDLRVEPAGDGRRSAPSRARSSAGSSISESFVRVTFPLSLPGVFAGLAADVHPGDRRLRQRRVPGQPGHPHDRQRDPEQVPDPERLSDGGRPVVHADGRRAGRGRDLCPRPGHGRRLHGAPLTWPRPTTAATDIATADVAQTTRRRGRNVVERWLDRYLLIIYTVLAVIYLMLPVALIILFSFNNPAGKSNVTWQGFTLKYWLNPLGVDGLPQAVGLSLVIAILSTLIATVLGHAHRACPRPLRLPGPAGDERAHLPARWRRPRSSSAPRC